MIDWSQHIVREIAKGRCILFLGAGVSASAQAPDGSSPKDWGSFISEAATLIKDHKKQRDVEWLIDSKNYLLALQGISKAVDIGDYYELLNRNFNNPLYEPSNLHKTIFDLDVRIVITTNFDKIFENYCYSQSADGYKTIQYDSTSLVDEIKSDTRLIIKAHGSINEINKMIFTKSQYHGAKRRYPNFYEILKSLFITNTLLFVGCSLTDPDVCLLLEEVKIIGSSAKPYYVLIKQDEQNPVAIEDWKDSYNIIALEYGPDHEDLTTSLKDLGDQVLSHRATLGIGSC